MRRTLQLGLVLVLISQPAIAGWIRAGLYGADVRALVIHPQKPDLIFLGTSQGEVYGSRDGARSWENRRGGIPFPGYVVDNLSIDQRGRLWAACWGLWGGGVIAVSADDGVTWSRRDAGLEDFSVRALANDPQNPERILAGGLTGVYQSLDDGKTWKKLSEHVNVESLAIDPRHSERIYVGTWRQAWRSDDGGKNWKHIEKGMVLDTDIFSINIDPRNPDNLWIGTCGWVYNSCDRGDTWVRYRDGFNNRRVHAVDYDPQDPNMIYAGSVGGLYRSRNGGKIWDLISEENLVVNVMGMHSARPDRIILGTEGDGIYVSFDRGESFERSNQGLHNVKVAAVVPDPRIKNRLYAAVMFGGAASGIYRSNDGGENWERLSTTQLPEVLSLVVREEGETRFLVGTEKGFFWSSSGAAWTQAEPLETPLRVEKILPYNSQRLFAATAEGVFTSKDAGRSWYRLGESKERILDMALGRLGEGRALYALTTFGLTVFDGNVWRPVLFSPAGGHSIAVRGDGEVELVVIGGSAGVFAGHVDYAGVWKPAEGPKGTLASVYQTLSKSVFVNLRDPSQLLISSAGKERWRSLPLPMHSKNIAAIATDPFHSAKLYLGTIGQGVFIWDDGTDIAASANSAYLGGGTK